MKAAMTFKFSSDSARLLFGMLDLMLFGYWLALLSIAFNAHALTDGVKAWLIFAAVVLVLRGGYFAKRIVAGAKLFLQLRTPSAASRQWRIQAFHAMTRHWAFTVVAGTLLLALPGAPLNILSAAALFSVALSMSATLAIFTQPSLRSYWSGAVMAVTVYLFITQLILRDVLSGSDHAPLYPPAFTVSLEILLALSWPLLAFKLKEDLSKLLTFSARLQTRPVQPSQPLGRRIQAYFRRYAKLSSLIPYNDSKHAKSSPLALNLLFAQGIWYGVAQGWLVKRWGGDFTLLRLALIFVMALLMLNALIFKDLHWRSLLAPGALRQGRLGWHIFNSTLKFVLINILPVGLCIGMVSWLAFNVSVPEMAAAVWKYRVLPLEWIAACSLAVALRSVGRSIYPGMFICFLLICAAMSAIAIGLPNISVLFPMDTGYALGLVLVTALLVMVANQLWTTQKLLPHLLAQTDR